MAHRIISAGAWLGVLCASALLTGGPFAAGTQTHSHNNTPIQHVIVIMQENRSFDSYFGTYPGANGFPQNTCVPLNPLKPQDGCVMPFHDQHDVNAGGPHSAGSAEQDADNGINAQKMDGFVQQQTAALQGQCELKKNSCKLYVPGTVRHDVMGYHTAAELPNYWAYARNFVLQDELFAGVRGWSMASHLDLTSEWSAICTNTLDVSTCTTNPISVQPSGTKVVYPWVNLFQLLDLNGVSWKYYLAKGTEPDCDDDAMTCDPQVQNNGVLSLWNPAPGFAYVEAQGQTYLAAHNPALDQFLVDIKNGTLPQVSWIVPSNEFSEHPTAAITAGQEYVTALINAVMQSPYWNNTAIFLAWDDWGGFYDHVVPPIVDLNDTSTPVQGFGFRVPGLLISAYAKPGLIDHSVLSLDSYAVLFEDLFMNSARLDPVKLGHPDARPDIRDKLTEVTFPDGSTAPIGNLIDEFDFAQAPSPPLILSTHIPTGIVTACGSNDPNNPQTCGQTDVKISWNAVAGTYVPGPFTYQISRDGHALASCRTNLTHCTDKGAPQGTHFYTVHSIEQNGVVSPDSAASEADVP